MIPKGLVSTSTHILTDTEAKDALTKITTLHYPERVPTIFKSIISAGWKNCRKLKFSIFRRWLGCELVRDRVRRGCCAGSREPRAGRLSLVLR